jgi:hypothetical protein
MRHLERRHHKDDLLCHAVAFLVSLDQPFDKQG